MERLKKLSGFALIFSLVASLALWGFGSTAQAQDAPPVPGGEGQLTDPSVEMRLTQNPFTVAPGEIDIFSFEHEGGAQPVHIWMDPEPNQGAGFKVFSANAGEDILQGADPDRFTPVGAGTANPVEPGWLFWRGVIDEPGQFYVVVENGWPEPVAYDLFAFGPGLATRVRGEQPLRREMTRQRAEMDMRADGDGVRTLPGQPGSLTNPPVEQALAQNEFVVQQGEHDIFVFKTESGGLPVHIWMDAEPDQGAGFKIYDEAAGREIIQGADPDRFTPVGAGTRNPNEPGTYFWRGSTQNDRRFYVVVDNGWLGPVPYDIFATGPGFVPVAS